MGWVTEPGDMYVRPVRRVAVRCPRKNGQWAIGVLISTLSSAEALQQMNWPAERVNDPSVVIQAYVYLYDQRGGGVETEIKEDKQGLATAKRNKKRFSAQEMLSQLEVIAHNLLVWARRWLRPTCPRIGQFGFLRLVRDVLRINGRVIWDATGTIRQIILNPADPLARELQVGLSALLADAFIDVILGET